MAKNPASTPELVDVAGFVTDAVTATPVAGLLADRPELLEARLTAEDWQAALDAYLASPRPAVGGVQPDETPAETDETDETVA